MLRLKSTTDYNHLRQSSHKVFGEYFIIVYQPNVTLLESVAGITVSKKVGNAVTRNAVKRRVKAFLRAYEVERFAPVFMSNIIALPSVVNADWKALCGDLQTGFERIIRSLCLNC